MKGKQKCGAVAASLGSLAATLRAVLVGPAMALRPIPIRAVRRR